MNMYDHSASLGFYRSIYGTRAVKRRENAAAREYGAVFLMQTGGKLRSARPRGRAPDYGDWARTAACCSVFLFPCFPVSPPSAGRGGCPPAISGETTGRSSRGFWNRERRICRLDRFCRKW
ncbi:MAG TPA: hypothetical protein H9684_03880 [Firmicutes bacterium]|nr:hypothetical protein [Bacillota bacterium]